jgi:hypothetical protein
MEYSLSWEDDSRSAGQQKTPSFMESSTCLQESST